MKYLFIGVFTLLCLFACQSNDSKYIIKGTLPTAQQDGEWIYLAPMENASIENIDSTRIENARFTFQGTGEEMKVLRMRILLRLKFQELLVVTEPGVTSVRIHQLGLRYTAKRRLAALERPEAKDRWRILCPMDSA